MNKTNIHDKFTVKSYQYKKAPKKIKLTGEKKNGAESAQHIIEFPGGAIELSRTSNNEYWAHIIVNHDTPIDDCEGLFTKTGQVVNSRVDYLNGRIVQIEYPECIRQIAVRIKTK